MECFGELQHGDLLLAAKLREHARQAVGTVPGSRAHAAAVHGVGDEPASVAVERRVVSKKRRGQLRVSERLGLEEA